jgi:hypothetical protein
MIALLKNFKAFSALSLILTLLLASKSVNAETRLSILNPGYDGCPGEWTAGKPRDVGSSLFIFYSNETSVGAKFFLNVTVHNVERLAGWGLGLIFDKTVLSYVRAWLPSDHVFKSVEEKGDGWQLVTPDVFEEEYDETHNILKWGCTYTMPEDECWSFNGSGTLCQIQFKILKETNAEFYFQFDSDWTKLYTVQIYDSFKLLEPMTPGPKLENAYFRFFGTEPKEDFALQNLLTVVIIIGIVVIVFAIIPLMFRRSKSKKISGKRKF